MVLIHVRDRVLLGPQQRAGVTDVGQEPFRGKVDDPAEACHQMGSGGLDAEEREISEIDKTVR